VTVLPARPATIDELAACVRTMLDVEVSAKPLAYLAHAFFADHLPGALGNTSDDAIDAVVWANRGGGKTFLGAVATLLDLVYKPGIEVRILGGSLDQAQRMHAHLRHLVRSPAVSGLVEGRVTDRRLELTNGSRLELLAQSQASVRGTRIQKLRCDEVELFDPAVWEAAQLTTRSKAVEYDGTTYTIRGSIEALSTMHRAHGLMRDVVEQASEGSRALFKWGVVDVLEHCGSQYECKGCLLWHECRGSAKSEDRSAGHLSIADAISLKGRVSLATWDAEMRCERPKSDDAVLPEFDQAVHVRAAPDVEEDWQWVLGMDFGYRSPTVIVWGAVSPEGVLHVVRERVASRCLLNEHIDAILGGGLDDEARAPAWIGIDPAGWQGNAQTGLSDAQQMQRAGLSVRARRTTIRAGLDLLRARLRPASGEPTLFISPQCPHLIESLERYHYDMQRPMSEEPAKDGPDHAVDALRYLVTNLDRPGALKAGSYL
jgi:hypothetical protein